MTTIQHLLVVLFALPATGPETLSTDGACTALLAAHVTDGHVRYAALCHDDRLAETIELFAGVDPDTIADDRDRLAFWINAYNAFTLSVICDHYPVGSINDLHVGGLVIGTILNRTVWDREFAVIGGRKYSLNHIEHDIIRRGFHDPRVHFALVCAARSCPPLRSEAYVGGRLDDQLDDQARRFFADPAHNRFDVATKTAYLSKILDWYEGDFGRSRRAVLESIARYLPDDARAGIEHDAGAWHVEYLHYDWSLND